MIKNNSVEDVFDIDQYSFFKRNIKIKCIFEDNSSTFNKKSQEILFTDEKDSKKLVKNLSKKFLHKKNLIQILKISEYDKAFIGDEGKMIFITDLKYFNDHYEFFKNNAIIGIYIIADETDPLYTKFSNIENKLSKVIILTQDIEELFYKLKIMFPIYENDSDFFFQNIKLQEKETILNERFSDACYLKYNHWLENIKLPKEKNLNLNCDMYSVRRYEEIENRKLSYRKEYNPRLYFYQTDYGKLNLNFCTFFEIFLEKNLINKEIAKKDLMSAFKIDGIKFDNFHNFKQDFKEFQNIMVEDKLEEKAIYLYLKNNFIARLINYYFRCEDEMMIFKIRYFIHCFLGKLQKEKEIYKKSIPRKLYKNFKFSNHAWFDEIYSEKTEIFFRGFLSLTEDENYALKLLEIEDDKVYNNYLLEFDVFEDFQEQFFSLREYSYNENEKEYLMNNKSGIRIKSIKKFDNYYKIFLTFVTAKQERNSKEIKDFSSFKNNTEKVYFSYFYDLPKLTSVYFTDYIFKDEYEIDLLYYYKYLYHFGESIDILELLDFESLDENNLKGKNYRDLIFFKSFFFISKNYFHNFEFAKLYLEKVLKFDEDYYTKDSPIYLNTLFCYINCLNMKKMDENSRYWTEKNKYNDLIIESIIVFIKLIKNSNFKNISQIEVLGSIIEKKYTFLQKLDDLKELRENLFLPLYKEIEVERNENDLNYLRLPLYKEIVVQKNEYDHVERRYSDSDDSL